MMRWLLAFALLVLTPQVVWGADGAYVGSKRRGNYLVQTYKLCDTKVAANSSCSEFDLVNEAGTQGTGVGIGLPDYFQASIEADTGCSATPDITILGRNVSTSGKSHTYSTTLVGGTGGTPTAAFFGPPVLPYVYATFSDDADCTDLTVYIHLYYRKNAAND